MKKFFTLINLSFILIFSGCTPLEFRSIDEPKEEKSFTKNEKVDLGNGYSKDDKYVYYESEIIEGLDPVKTEDLEFYKIAGNSMGETLQSGDYVFIDKMNYNSNSPQRGDIIMHYHPLTKDDIYLKRIIGLPNEIVIIEDGIVKIKNAENPNAYKLDESYLAEKFQGKTFIALGRKQSKFNVPENSYFVLGDNRTGSSDSRFWFNHDTDKPMPYLTKDLIIGKMWR